MLLKMIYNLLDSAAQKVSVVIEPKLSYKTLRPLRPQPKNQVCIAQHYFIHYLCYMYSMLNFLIEI